MFDVKLGKPEFDLIMSKADQWIKEDDAIILEHGDYFDIPAVNGWMDAMGKTVEEDILPKLIKAIMTGKKVTFDGAKLQATYFDRAVKNQTRPDRKASETWDERQVYKGMDDKGQDIWTYEKKEGSK